MPSIAFRTLKEQLNEDSLIPLNMDLPKDLKTLAVTGPILKDSYPKINWFAHMHQCGLPLPMDDLNFHF